MQIHTRFNDKKDVLTVELIGELDVTSVRILKKRIEQAIDDHKPNVEIECEELEYIDSTGIGALVSLAKKVSEYDAKIKLLDLKSHLKKIFELTKLTRIFIIEE